MCNLYHMAPKEHIERYFRAIVPELSAVPVGPFGTGLFLRPVDGQLQGVVGQWGMVQRKAKTRRPGSRAILTNNARVETEATRPTCRAASAVGQRCLIPAAWYQEPNWETGKNIWWRLARADGAPWAIAGLWSEWTDPATGEIVPRCRHRLSLNSASTLATTDTAGARPRAPKELPCTAVALP